MGNYPLNNEEVTDLIHKIPASIYSDMLSQSYS